jgi:2-methylcitrate synthase/citrate synthase II
MNVETHAKYSPGLEGIIAGESSICSVDRDAGLLYRGYHIDELAAHASFEEVVWLLLHGQLPTMTELGTLSRQMAMERPLPGRVVDMLHLLPAGTHPMDTLRTGVSMLSGFDPELNEPSHEASVRQAVGVIAKLSTLVTAGWHIAQGEEPVPHKPDLTHAGNFLYCFTGAAPEPWESEAFDTVLVLYADHEYNASTFAARVTASTMADLYAAVTAGLAALKGPLHGGANEASMRMLGELKSPEEAEAWLRERLARKEKIMGFGHRVYKKGDSRVPMMRTLARSLGERLGQEQWVPVCERLEAVMEREKQLCANVDLYAGPVLHMLNIPTELNTAIFACARVSGYCAHIIEQREHNRLIRPRSLYTGPAARAYPHGAAGKRAA